MRKILEQKIEQAQKIISKSKEWQVLYDKQANTMLENKQLLDQFYKEVKNYEHLQFYLTEVSPTLPNIFTIQVKYLGQPVATIAISKDNTTISTDLYNELNKKIYGCDIQLKAQYLKSKETISFLEYFKDIIPKNKINEQAHLESMLLAEFSKTSSATKLLIGIQPIKYANIFYPIPIMLDPKEKTSFIELLTRTKIRKLTIIETMKEDQTPETVLTQATHKAVFLCNLLHTEKGQEWYRIMGFNGKVTSHLTIKVCIAIPESLKAKVKEFEPYELSAETDNIEYHYMTYETDGAKITKIDTTLNN